jgi:hypothetical protein
VIVFRYKQSETISSKDVSAFWYRRGGVDNPNDLELLSQNKLLQNNIYQHLHTPPLAVACGIRSAKYLWLLHN